MFNVSRSNTVIPLLPSCSLSHSRYDKASIWKALLGEHDFTQEEGTEVWRKVEKLIIHENYDPYESRHDIAIVKVTEN